MRVLVTGGAGFLGSHVTERLVRRGDSVVVVDDLSTGRRRNLARVSGHPNVRFVEGSMLRRGLLLNEAHGVDAIVHLAASVGVARVLERPGDMLERNVEGTLCVLDAAVASGARVLFASSSEVYGLVPRVPAREDDPLLTGFDEHPRWGYARSKAFGEAILRDARDAGAIDTLSMRLFNTVGPRQVGCFGMVVPSFVERALAGEPLVVHGDGRQRRAFGHVFDTADTIVDLLRVPDFGDLGIHAVNVGGTEEITVLELAERVLKRTGSSSSIEFRELADPQGRPIPETPRRVPDLARLETCLAPRRRRTLDVILDDVIADMRRSDVGDSRARVRA